MNTRAFFHATACVAVGLACALIPARTKAEILGASAATTQTLVFIRHGEKPVDVDNGQLTCQGANRAAALPDVLIPKFGTPNFIFAGATVANQNDQGQTYYYLRALATIEPTAVKAGVTVDLQFAKDDIDDLQKELAKAQYQNATVFIAWEHSELDDLVVNIVKKYGGNTSQVPAWASDDYDSIFVLRLTGAPQTAVVFEHDHEGLDDRSTDCQADVASSIARDGLPPPRSGRP